MSSGCRYIDRGTPESDIPASSQSDSRSNVVLEYLRVDPDTREIGNRVQRIADIVKFESVGLRFAVALERRTSIFEVSGCQIHSTRLWSRCISWTGDTDKQDCSHSDYERRAYGVCL